MYGEPALDANQQPLIPAFSLYEGEKENLRLVLEQLQGFGSSNR
jgi:hypothetical protein